MITNLVNEDLAGLKLYLAENEKCDASGVLRLSADYRKHTKSEFCVGIVCDISDRN